MNAAQKEILAKFEANKAEIAALPEIGFVQQWAGGLCVGYNEAEKKIYVCGLRGAEVITIEQLEAMAKWEMGPAVVLNGNKEAAKLVPMKVAKEVVIAELEACIAYLTGLAENAEG